MSTAALAIDELIPPATRSLIAAYLLECERRALRRSTVVAYQSKLVGFARSFSPGEIVDAGRGEIDGFLDRRRLLPKTRYAWLSTLHGFFEWAVLEGHAPADPTVRIRRPRSPRVVPRPIRDEDLFDALAGAPSELRAMITLAAFQGLRCREIATLFRDDILDRNDPPVLIVANGKGGHQRVLPLHAAIMPALRLAGLPRSGHVFTRSRGGPYPPANISRMIAVYFDDLGIDATAHQLRHWFGTKTYKACSDLRVVQELMGHSSPSTTAMYTAYSQAGARDAVNALTVSR